MSEKIGKSIHQFGCAVLILGLLTTSCGGVQAAVSSPTYPFPLLAGPSVWIAGEDGRMTFTAKYCIGQTVPNHKAFSTVCNGIVLELEGSAQKKKGDVMDCPEVLLAEELECYVSGIPPMQAPIKPIPIPSPQQDLGPEF